LSDTRSITVLADGAKWIWNQLAEHLPGVTSALDIYHASEHLWDVARTRLSEGTAQTRAWVAMRRETLLRLGASGLLAELRDVEEAGLRGYFEPHADHAPYPDRLRRASRLAAGWWRARASR
jgi:hypothetical protein